MHACVCAGRALAQQQQQCSCPTRRPCWVLSGVLLWLQLLHAWRTWAWRQHQRKHTRLSLTGMCAGLVPLLHIIEHTSCLRCMPPTDVPQLTCMPADINAAALHCWHPLVCTTHAAQHCRHTSAACMPACSVPLNCCVHFAGVCAAMCCSSCAHWPLVS